MRTVNSWRKGSILDYNIALLRLKGPVPTYGTKDGVSPVCLPDANFDYNGMESSSLLWRFYNGGCLF